MKNWEFGSRAQLARPLVYPPTRPIARPRICSPAPPCVRLCIRAPAHLPARPPDLSSARSLAPLSVRSKS